MHYSSLNVSRHQLLIPTLQNNVEMDAAQREAEKAWVREVGWRIPVYEIWILWVFHYGNGAC